MQIATIRSQFGGGPQNPGTIIIHSMGEYIENGNEDFHAKEWLDKLGLSAHYLVCPSGVIIQTRNKDEIAWHAKGHNTDSIGIEFLVPGLHTYGTFLEAIKKKYLTNPQYQAGVELCVKLKEEGLSNMTRHDLLDPGRKFDPGKGFPWDKFKQDTAF